MNQKIIVHCLIKNEERFIWYAVNSVLPYVDKILIWDTGSTDNTHKIIASIKSKKISFKKINSVTKESFPELRQEMLNATNSSYTWLMILDGDEIWPTDSITKVLAYAKSHPNIESIVVHSHNLVGDIYHRLKESAGQYQFKNKKGHLALRFINLKQIKGLNVKNPYGQEGYYDSDGKLIQNRDSAKIAVLNESYFHATHLKRSSKDNLTLKRTFKQKYELGEKINPTKIPLIFFSPRPNFVPDVTERASIIFWTLATILTPFRRIKRILFKPQSGY